MPEAKAAATFNLRALRKSKGISQKQLAEDLHLSQPTVCEWEAGKKFPSTRNLLALAQYFSISFEELAGQIMPSSQSSRIRSAIDESGLSYGELSKATGIPKSALQRYATGETEKCPAYRLIAIADATGVSRSYLLGDDTAADAAAPVTQASGGHQLSTFRGITITMAWQPDAPAHFQASYADSSINISVDTLEVTEGSLPRKQQLMVLGWAALRQDQLMECWELASRQYAPYQIEPLR